MAKKELVKVVKQIRFSSFNFFLKIIRDIYFYASPLCFFIWGWICGFIYKIQ